MPSAIPPLAALHHAEKGAAAHEFWRKPSLRRRQKAIVRPFLPVSHHQTSGHLRATCLARRTAKKGPRTVIGACCPENHSTDRSTLGIGVDVAPIYNRFSDPARELIGGLTGNFVRQLCCPRQGKVLQMRRKLLFIS